VTAPTRIQLRRTKGWRKPPSIVVARPSRWGNPWPVGTYIGADMDAPDAYRGAAALVTPQLAKELFRSALLHPSDGPVVAGLNVTVVDVRTELAGHDLACWCPLDQPCHADVLLELANP